MGKSDDKFGTSRAEPATDLLGTKGRGPGKRLQLAIIGQQSFDSFDLPQQGDLVIGRGDQADISLDESTVSRRHAILHMGNQLEIEDLGSANGTKVQDIRIAPNQRVKIGDGDVISIGTTVLIVQRSAGAARPRRLWQHGYFEVRLEDECVRAQRSSTKFAIARIQIQLAANPEAVLEILASALRMSDILARYGPNDYEALLVDAEPEEAATIVQRVVSRLEDGGIPARAGTAAYPRDGRTPEALVAAVTRQIVKPTTDSNVSIVVEDPLMQRLYAMVSRVASSLINVLVLGETGVGKEVVAEAIHYRSPRADRPYLRLNCAAFSETLLESELFGHEKGAFTGAVQTKPGLLETAQGGTVLLDEVGELPLAVQAKLLRVIDTRQVMRVGGLQSRPIDVRFVAATNRDLEAEIVRGTFRQDLFFRLSGFTIFVPPLRQRSTEIESLATVFLSEASRQASRPAIGISAAALDLLRRYSWPGNVRELRNVMERAVVLCSGDVITPDHLPVEKMGETVTMHAPRVAAAEEARPRVHRPTLPAMTVATQPVPVPDDDDFSGDERDERDRIVDALTRAGGNQSRAAQLLGISRGTLIQRIARYRIPRPRKGQD